MKSSTDDRKRTNQAEAEARRRLKRTISRAREGFEDDAENLAIAMIDEEDSMARLSSPQEGVEFWSSQSLGVLFCSMHPLALR